MQTQSQLRCLEFRGRNASIEIAYLIISMLKLIISFYYYDFLLQFKNSILSMFLNKLQRISTFLLKKVDLFPTTHFLKFKKESQYTTATGGLLSLGIIFFILILFFNRGMQTLNRQIINSSESSQMELEPTPISVVTSPQGGFMFALVLVGLNLNDPLVTYFDISLTQDYWSPIKRSINRTNVPLVQCTAAHFAFNEDVLNRYVKVNLQNALCPPLGYEFIIGGKVTSQVYSQFNVNIRKCNVTVNSKCASDTLIQSLLGMMGAFRLAVPVINTIINPNDQKYRLQYFEDRNTFLFTPSYGVEASAEISQFQVDTDTSIFPFPEVVTEQINTIPGLFVSRGVQIKQQSSYVQLQFSKSSLTRTYTRNFIKLDDFISYIGGLIGSFLVLFLVFKTYSDRCFLIDIAANILEKQESEDSLKKYNVFYDLGVLLKKVLNFLHIKMRWKFGETIIESMEEMEHQLDISFLLHKISFLEKAITSILSEHQIDALCLRDKKTLETLKNLRIKHQITQPLSHTYLNRAWLTRNAFDELSESQHIAHNNHNDKQLQKIKDSVEKVITQPKDNNVISESILKKVEPAFFQKICFVEEYSGRQLKDQNKKNGEEPWLNIVKNSKNAVANVDQFNFSFEKNKEVLVEDIENIC